MENKIKINDKITIGKNCPAFFIGDVGANHNCDLLQAKKIIDLAVSSGLDAIKFQSYRLDHFINSRYNPEGYKLIKKYQIPFSWNRELKEYCDKKGIVFMTTPFDVEIVDHLEEIGIECYKIASCDITFTRLLHRVAETGKPVILSTGGASVREISNAVKIFEKHNNDKVVLLHAVVNYPCNYEEINLAFMPKLGTKYSTMYGLSDHSLGNEISLAAVALGAKVIEKHLTESRVQKGPDHKHSMEICEFKELVGSARLIEKGMGSASRIINVSEEKRMKKARRGFYAVKGIKKGEILSPENVRELRPRAEMGPELFRRVFGKKAIKNIQKNQVITREHIL